MSCCRLAYISWISIQRLCDGRIPEARLLTTGPTAGATTGATAGTSAWASMAAAKKAPTRVAFIPWLLDAEIFAVFLVIRRPYFGADKNEYKNPKNINTKVVHFISQRRQN